VSIVTNNLGNDNDPIQSGEADNAAANLTAQRAVQALREKVAELPPEKHEEVHSLIDDIEEMLEKGPESLSTPRTMIMELVTYWPDAVPWLTSQAALIIRGIGGG